MEDPIVCRSLQFSSFEAVYTYYEGSWACAVVPFFPGGLQYRVIVGGAASAVTRAVIETPMELIALLAFKHFEINFDI